MTSKINRKPARSFWVNSYLVLDELHKNDEVIITFPMVETVETNALTWKEQDFWPEPTNPGETWQPGNTVHTMYFRGNTLVDISPRSEVPGYPLYLRNHLKQKSALMKEVMRYVSPVVPRW